MIGGLCFIRCLIKVKYFPNCTIFDANSSSDSFAWKSILRLRNLIDREARWRIGNGQSIRIFEDAWLLSTADQNLFVFIYLGP